MAGFGSFFTSLSSSLTSLTSVFNVQYYSEETVEVKGRNSAVENPISLREQREGGIKASGNQASKKSREARRAGVDAAHATIYAQTELGRTAVNYGAKKQLLESKLNKVDEEIRGLRGEKKVAGKRNREESEAPLSNPYPPNPKHPTLSESGKKKLGQLMTQKLINMHPKFQAIALKKQGFKNPKEAIKQMERWSREKDAEKLTEEGPPRTKVRLSARDENGNDLQTGKIRNIPLMEFQEREEMQWWKVIARKAFRNNDVDSVTIGKKGTLTRLEAENLGWLRGDGKGGGGKGGGGRGMGG